METFIFNLPNPSLLFLSLRQEKKIEKKAHFTIKCHNLDSTPFLKKNARKGVGSYKRLKMKHHAFIFSLYLSNPSLPNYGYFGEMKEKYGISISTSFISRWFKTIGPFKGNYRKTSRFPPAKYRKKNTRLLKRYLAFASQFDPSRFVFADEKISFYKIWAC